MRLVSSPSSNPPASSGVVGHHGNHENGGSDEVNVGGLSGELADVQKPKTHSDSAHSLGYVHDSGAEIVAGKKSFSTFPETPASAPTTDYQVANKKYVDDNIGGGGGGTKTKFNFNLNSNASTTVTHPAVSLTDPDKISTYAWWTTNGESSNQPNIQFDMTTGKDNDTYWTIPDLNTGGASWVDEGGGTGHFSVDPGDVVANCDIRINGVTYYIVTKVGTGVANGSVTLSGTPGSNFAITWIRGINYVQGGPCNAHNVGATNNGFWRTVKSSASNMLTSSQKALSSVFDDTGLGGTVQTQNAGRIKVAISLDNGATWQYYDGSAWQTMLETEFATKGMELIFGGWNASDNSPMYTHWASISADLSTANIRLLFGFFGATDVDYSYIQSLTMRIHEKATPHMLPSKIGFDNYFLGAKRISTTEITVTNLNNATMNGIDFVVVTP